MPLNIRNPRAAELARKLASRRGINMTAAIVQALEHEIERDRAATPLADRLSALAAKARGQAGPNRQAVTKADRDALWGEGDT